MNVKKTSAAAVAAIGLVGAAAGVALAGNPRGPLVHDTEAGSSVSQPVSPASDGVLAAFPALTTPRPAADVAAEASLRDALGSTSDADRGPIATADFARARSSVVAGSSARAWLIPSGDRVCTVLEDPAGGYGASCNSLTDVGAGRAWIALGPAQGSSSTSVTIAVAVASGGARPTIRRADGTSTPLMVDGGVAAAVVHKAGGADLDVGPSSVPLSTFLRAGR
jgi:hypothetical protein